MTCLRRSAGTVNIVGDHLRWMRCLLSWLVATVVVIGSCMRALNSGDTMVGINAEHAGRVKLDYLWQDDRFVLSEIHKDPKEGLAL
eukprot:5122423-Amphidinium_carterae.1